MTHDSMRDRTTGDGISAGPSAAPPVAGIEADGRRYELVLPNAAEDHIQKLLMQTGRPYELGMLQDMHARLAPGDLVLDIGANVGNHTLYLACVAGARVIAFEPNRDLCAAMEASLARNGVEDRVSLRVLGLGETASRAHFAEAVPQNLGTQALALGAGEIEVATLDGLGIEGPVRAIKLDVEGMEAAVLRGGAALIARDRPVLYVEAMDEPTFREISIWAQEAGYTHWETFNATPTHLFRPAETVSVDARLERLAAREVIREYRATVRDEARRRAQAEARETAALEAELAARRERIEALVAELAEKREAAAAWEVERKAAAEAARRQERQILKLGGHVARAQADFDKLLKYGQILETRHRAVLESETWRAMEPARRLLQRLRRRPAPPAFKPRLGAPGEAAPKGAPGATAEWRRWRDDGSGSGRVPLLPFDATVPRAETVTVFMATYPARRANLPAVVAALLPQCDLLSVYLNEFDTVPDCLKAERIRVTLGRDAAGDLKDNGKFFDVAAHPEGYHVFVDDDLIYPPDYVARIVEGIRAFGYRAIVGFHGTTYLEPLASYIKNRAVLPYFAASRSALVDQLGTGTTGYHSSTFTVDRTAFETTGIADLWFARDAAARGVPLAALERPAGWLHSMEETGDTLFRQAERDDSLQTQLLHDRLAPALREGPRLRLARFLRDLYTPAHLARAGFDLEHSLAGAFGEGAEAARRDLHFAVIVTGWNCAGFAEACLDSLERQIPGDYGLEIHVYDDGSDDGTWAAIERRAEVLNIRALRGTRNMGPAFARDALIRSIAEPDTICVLLDLDDRLLPQALARLEDLYRADPELWMTYGNWENQTGVVNAEGFYTPEEIDARAYRQGEVFKFTALRTFRRFLYDRVAPEHLKDAEGGWLRYCSDVGLMLPLVDQCAGRNIRAIDEPLYVYNQYRASGTQKRFGTKKKETFRYLRDNRALFRFDA